MVPQHRPEDAAARADALCIQLDWFPGDGATRTSSMQVDWVKQYALDTGRQPAEPKTDQPDTNQHSGYKTAAATSADPAWRWVRRPAATSGTAGAPSGTPVAAVGGGPGR